MKIRKKHVNFFHIHSETHGGQAVQTKTMRIKKVYLNEIKSGEKIHEWRADSPYYAWLEHIETPFILRLHYQVPSEAIAVVVSEVRRLSRPEFIQLIDTPDVWRLTIKEVL